SEEQHVSWSHPQFRGERRITMNQIAQRFTSRDASLEPGKIFELDYTQRLSRAYLSWKSSY
ncbi:MAG: hypothetical protein WCN99_06515, partial [bacterium]